MLRLLDDFLIWCRGGIFKCVGWFDDRLNASDLTSWYRGLGFFFLLFALAMFLLVTMPITFLMTMRAHALEEHPVIIAERARVVEERRTVRMTIFRTYFHKMPKEKVNWKKEGF